MAERAFILKISKTAGLSIASLTQALARTAGQIDSGRLRPEGGIVRGPGGQAIGTYHWEDQAKTDE
jgi:hypothetical protein